MLDQSADSKVDRLAGRLKSGAPMVQSASGAWLTTETGTQVDYLLGNCCNLLGHAHPHVVDAVRSQIGRGANVGDSRHESAYRLAERISAIAGKHSVRLVSSGSEAVHTAIRAARSSTRRSMIVKFEGHFHGWFSEEIARFVPDLEYGEGLPPRAGENLLTVPWNDAPAFAQVMEEHGHEVAAVICEPVLCHAGTIPPNEGYLQRLRDACDAFGALLIFDECITGFRLGIGGAQQHFGVNADLVAYSKALSGGLPIGVCAGTEAAMEGYATGLTFQAATYDANLISVAAALAVLDVLDTGEPYRAIANYSESLTSAMSAELSAYGVSHRLQGDPSVFQMFYTDRPVTNHREAFETDIALHVRLTSALVERGVNVYMGDIRSNPRASWLSQWFVSAAHGPEHLDFTMTRYRDALASVLSSAAASGGSRSRPRPGSR